jgi:hypothetical protein
MKPFDFVQDRLRGIQDAGWGFPRISFGLRLLVLSFQQQNGAQLAAHSRFFGWKEARKPPTKPGFRQNRGTRDLA